MNLDENDMLFLLHVANQTGSLGRNGFARQGKDIGFMPSIAEGKRKLDEFVKRGLLAETPGTAYLCITINGVLTLRHEGRL